MLSPPLSFSDLPGWAQDDHRAALAAFLRHCGDDVALPEAGRPAGRLGISPAALRHACHAGAGAMADGSDAAARRFFETMFEPRRVLADGFVTGYFEPEYPGSRHRDAVHATPLLRRPENLVALDDANRPAHLPSDAPFALRDPDGALVLPPDRGEIMDGALSGHGLELVWLTDPVDAFYVHVQGSARIRLKEGGVLRVGYAGKTGHPYSPIGRVMIERGLAEPGTVTMDVLRGWLAENPAEIDGVLRRNRSYIFFREVTEAGPDDGPVGAAGLPLVAGRSLAVDAAFHAYGTPVFVSADLPAGDGRPARPFRRLMVADDTGSAIIGAARGDIFFGSGRQAGARAGSVQHRADMVVLVPRGAGREAPR
ncbi:murein transglycosylase A [Stappia sp.]|uniref:murein transglycosylase A n=1 Tax=Stappia sp. TaxID=1870903 RepID=UPI003A98D7CF